MFKPAIRTRRFARHLSRTRRSKAFDVVSVAESLESRRLLAVTAQLITQSPFRYNAVRDNTSVDSDRLDLADRTLPVNLNYSFDVNRDSFPAGEASATLIASTTPADGGGIASFDASIGASGQEINANVFPQRATAYAEVIVRLSVTDAPIEARITGEVNSAVGSNLHYAFLRVQVPNGSGGRMNLETVAQTRDPMNEIDQTVVFEPGIYDVLLQSQADVRWPTTRTSSAQLAIDFQPSASPVLEPIGDQSTIVNELLEFTVTATDPDSQSDDLTFSLGTDASNTMSIDENTGVFRWTPDSVGERDVTIIVTDEAGNTDSETITIDVVASDEFRWNVAGNGNYDEESNWDVGAVPGSDDLVYFEVPAVYTVQIGEQTVERVFIGGDPSAYVEFENVLLTAQSTNPNSPGVVVNQGEFHLLDGAITSNHSLIGDSATTRVELRPGADWQNAARFIVGGGGDALMRVRSGSQLVSPELLIGHAVGGAPGELQVSGANARVVTNATSIGSLGTGKLLVDLGGRFDSTTATVIGSKPGSTGEVIVRSVDASGNPSTLRTEGINGLFTVGEQGSGTLTVVDGGLVESDTALARVGLRAPGTLTITGSGPDGSPASRFVVLPSNIFFLLGVRAEGTATVDDGGILDIQSDAIIGSGASGNLLVKGIGDLLSSEFTVGRNLILGEEAGGDGTLRIEDGGRAALTGAHLLDENDTPAVTLGKVDGASGKLIVSGVNSEDETPSTLDLGQSSLVLIGAGGTGQLKVLHGGRVEGTAIIGVGEDGPGEALVSGTDAATGMRSTLEGQFLVLGANSSGILNVNEGARAALSFLVNLRSGSTATIDGSGGGHASELETLQLLVAASEADTQEIDSAVLTVSDGGVVTVLDEINIGTGGTIDTGSGSVTVGASDPMPGWLRLGPGGTLAGTGRIFGSLDQDGGVDNFGGEVIPGSSPGILTIGGDYRQGSDGKLIIEVAGPDPGTGYDQLVVSGNATLNGTLELQFIDGYVPGPNDTFEFIVSEAVNGQFEDVMVTGLPAGMVPDLNLTETGLAIDVVAETSSSLSGRSFDDRNGDGARQSHEPWLDGWMIHLLDRDGNVLQSQTTSDRDVDSNGSIDPETERGWYHFDNLPEGKYYLQQTSQDGWHQTGPFDPMELDVWELDRDHDFRGTGNLWENWGGLGEKWFWGNSGWHFVTPDGTIYKWDGSPASNLTGNEVTQLPPEYATDAALIFDAQLPDGSRVSTVAGQDARDVNFGNRRDERYPFENRPGSGNVTVQMIGTDLHLFGDAQNNGITIYRNPSGYLAVGGHGNTTVNASTDPYVTGWTAIPDDLRIWTYGGDDTIALQDVNITGDLFADLSLGADHILGNNVSVGGTSYLISVGGDSVVGFRDSVFTGPSTMITGAGQDLLLNRNVSFGSTSYVDTGLNDDLVLMDNSRLNRGATMLLSGGRDRLAFVGDNVVRQSLLAIGGASQDSYHVPVNSRFDRDPTMLEFESSSIDGINSLLDDVLEELAEQGLGGLL